MCVYVYAHMCMRVCFCVARARVCVGLSLPLSLYAVCCACMHVQTNVLMASKGYFVCHFMAFFSLEYWQFSLA